MAYGNYRKKCLIKMYNGWGNNYKRNSTCSNYQLFTEENNSLSTSTLQQNEFCFICSSHICYNHLWSTVAPTPSSSSSSKPLSLPEQIYSLANSSLRNSSHFPGGGLWDAALLNTNSTAYSQLGFLCEKIAMFEVLSTLQESSSVFNVKRRDIVWDNNHVAVALESACHLWNCPVNSDVDCIRNRNTCLDFKEFLNKMRLYCPKVLLKKFFTGN